MPQFVTIGNHGVNLDHVAKVTMFAREQPPGKPHVSDALRLDFRLKDVEPVIVFGSEADAGRKALADLKVIVLPPKPKDAPAPATAAATATTAK